MTGTIVFEEKGFPVELVTERDIERAIAAGRIRPDTLVTTRRGDETPVVSRARDVARLKPYFDLPEDGPEPQALELEREAAPPPEPEAEPEAGEAVEASWPPSMMPPPHPAQNTRAPDSAAAARRAEAKAAYIDPEGFLGCAFAPLVRYADFMGRTSRREYASFVTLQFVAYVAIMTLFEGSRDLRTSVLALTILGLFLPNLAAAARRLHDHDKSAWLLLLSFIPYVGPLILLVLMCLPGDPQDNRHGSDPARG